MFVIGFAGVDAEATAEYRRENREKNTSESHQVVR